MPIKSPKKTLATDWPRNLKLFKSYAGMLSGESSIGCTGADHFMFQGHHVLPWRVFAKSAL